MNKKLKELIEDIKYGIENGKDKETNIEIDGYCLSWKNCKIILDYITNLQEQVRKAKEYDRIKNNWYDLKTYCKLERHESNTMKEGQIYNEIITKMEQLEKGDK